MLDQSPISEGSCGREALANTLDLARLADRVGYHRYWVAEHHGTPMLAGASPEVLVGPIAATTRRLRVGSGGVLLPHYSPLKVAESFSVLSALFPGRIDLGVGRSPGTDRVTISALRRDRRRLAPDDFAPQLAELLAYLRGRFGADDPFRRLAALPGGDERPEVWLLGSSLDSARWAAKQALPYVFADFINPDGGESAERYRSALAAAEAPGAARVAVAVWAICAESDDEAHRLASSSRMCTTLLRQGLHIPVPPIGKAERFLAGREDSSLRGPSGRPWRRVLGSPDTVRAGLQAVAAEYGAEEVIVVGITHEHAARRRSYELIAQAFALSGASPGGSVEATD